MPCLQKTYPSLTVIPTSTRERTGSPFFMRTIVAFVDALRDAWTMRCAIRSRYPFDYE